MHIHLAATRIIELKILFMKYIMLELSRKWIALQVPKQEFWRALVHSGNSAHKWMSHNWSWLIICMPALLFPVWSDKRIIGSKLVFHPVPSFTLRWEDHPSLALGLLFTLAGLRSLLLRVTAIKISSRSAIMVSSCHCVDMRGKVQHYWNVLQLGRERAGNIRTIITVWQKDHICRIEILLPSWETSQIIRLNFTGFINLFLNIFTFSVWTGLTKQTSGLFLNIFLVKPQWEVTCLAFVYSVEREGKQGEQTQDNTNTSVAAGSLTESGLSPITLRPSAPFCKNTYFL